MERVSGCHSKHKGKKRDPIQEEGPGQSETLVQTTQRQKKCENKNRFLHTIMRTGVTTVILLRAFQSISFLCVVSCMH